VADHRRAASDAQNVFGNGSRSMDLGSSEGRPAVKTVIRERLETLKIKEAWAFW